jgi:hypothetical protein
VNLAPIEIIDPGPTPRFRIRSESGSPTRIVGLVVQDVAAEDYIWALAPPGFVLSVENAYRGEVLYPTKAEPLLRSAEATFEDTVTTHGVSVDEVIYGVIPQGLEQGIPAIGPPPRLVRGRTYVVMMHGESVGLATFTA